MPGESQRRGQPFRQFSDGFGARWWHCLQPYATKCQQKLFFMVQPIQFVMDLHKFSSQLKCAITCIAYGRSAESYWVWCARGQHSCGLQATSLRVYASMAWLAFFSAVLSTYYLYYLLVLSASCHYLQLTTSHAATCLCLQYLFSPSFI